MDGVRALREIPNTQPGYIIQLKEIGQVIIEVNCVVYVNVFLFNLTIVAFVVVGSWDFDKEH